MKRILLIAMALCLFAGPAAAASATVTADQVYGSTRFLKLACVGDPDDLTLYGVSGMVQSLVGWWVVSVEIENTSAQVDTDADADVYLKNSKGTDFLGGDGVDELDPDAVNNVVLTTSQPINSDPILVIENQTQATGAYTIVFSFKFLK